MPDNARLGIVSLTALVIGNMLGAGIFTTSGFALADLGSPFFVLLAWLLGGLLALCGALSYGALARLMPVSGGEYFFLSRAVGPMIGFLAGWISLWAGFTAAIAFAAITFEVYLLPGTAGVALPENSVATVVILLAALAHGLNVRQGARVQNAAVLLKLSLLCGFILYVFAYSEPGHWPGLTAWQSSQPAQFSVAAFASTLMWVSFSYSGFNASVYIASEADSAARQVPRAMLYATSLLIVLYLVLNTIFLFAPAPGVIAGQEDIAALAAEALAGETLANAIRGIIALAMFTSVSAMIMTGPRVYAQMARDGLMPSVMRFEGGTPAMAIAVQAGLAIAVVWMSGLRELLSYLGFTLGLSTVVTIGSLFLVVHRNNVDTRNLPGYPWAPAIFIACTLLLAILAATINLREMLAAVLTILSALIVYALFGRHHVTLK